MLNLDLKRFGIVLLSLVVIRGGPPPGVGYLPRIGPTPLRFQLLRTQSGPITVLPPLKTTDDSTNAPADFPIAKDEAATSPQAESFDPAQGLSLPQPVDPGAVTNVGPSVQIVGPQMLMHYFIPPTNQVFISVPVEFTPPGPPFVKGSTATYISH